jgi:hypothetical protein
MGGQGPFSSLVAVHQRLIREPAHQATGTALYPRDDASPDRWTPTFELSPYRAARPEDLELGGTESFHELESARLAAAILCVVDLEGPLHFDVLGDRLLTAAGVGRMGSRIRARIEAELQALAAAAEIVADGEFIGRHVQLVRPPSRDWRELPDKHRKLEYVADTELMLCLFHAVLDDEGIDADEAKNRGIHRIGFPRLTEKARERLEAPLAALLERQLLRRAGSGLHLGLTVFLRWPIEVSRKRPRGARDET